MSRRGLEAIRKELAATIGRDEQRKRELAAIEAHIAERGVKRCPTRGERSDRRPTSRYRQRDVGPQPHVLPESIPTRRVPGRRRQRHRRRILMHVR